MSWNFLNDVLTDYFISVRIDEVCKAAPENQIKRALKIPMPNWDAIIFQKICPENNVFELSLWKQHEVAVKKKVTFWGWPLGIQK